MSGCVSLKLDPAVLLKAALAGSSKSITLALAMGRTMCTVPEGGEAARAAAACRCCRGCRRGTLAAVPAMLGASLPSSDDFRLVLGGAPGAALGLKKLSMVWGGLRAKQGLMHNLTQIIPVRRRTT